MSKRQNHPRSGGAPLEGEEEVSQVSCKIAHDSIHLSRAKAYMLNLQKTSQAKCANPTTAKSHRQYQQEKMLTGKTDHL